MLKYIVKRILIFIPTLIIITLLGFIISINAPGDPVERMVVAAQSGGEMGSQSLNQIEQKKIWREKPPKPFRTIELNLLLIGGWFSAQTNLSIEAAFYGKSLTMKDCTE